MAFRARKVSGLSRNRPHGPLSRKFRELFGPEKPVEKLRPAYSVKLVFSYVVKEIKIKITAKFRASTRLRFEDTKRILSPEIRPKRFGTFEKPELAAFSKPYRVIASRCVITLLRLDTFCPRQCTCRVNHFVAVTK